MRLIGVDVGGTFTDIVFADTESGRTLIHKVPTTPDDPARGVIAGIVELCEREGVPRAASGPRCLLPPPGAAGLPAVLRVVWRARICLRRGPIAARRGGTAPRHLAAADTP